MKYCFVLLFAFLFAGCNKTPYLELNGTTPGIDDGLFLIKDLNDSTVYGGNIKAGKFHLKEAFRGSGYCYLSISQSGKKPLGIFDVYLEGGTYNITTNRDKPYLYPDIQSGSKKETELATYFHLVDSMTGTQQVKVRELTAQMNSSQTKLLSAAAYTALANKLQASQLKELSATNALAAFVNKYPDNEVASYIMSNMNYHDDPQAYYKVYQKFSATDKNSATGKELGNTLSNLVRLNPGKLAPDIAGTTPDGKKIDLLAMNKKLILIEFWRSGSSLNRSYHQTMVLNPFPEFKKGELGIVSVSFDTKRDHWLAAIRDDKLNWTQVSDLKGDDSPNTDKWGITTLPVYDLIDAKGRFVDLNIPFDNLAFSISDYMEKHH
jgi:hypothetical protein